MGSLFSHLNVVVHTPGIVYSTDIVVQKTSLDWTTSHFIRLADRLSLSNNQTLGTDSFYDQDWRRRP